MLDFLHGSFHQKVQKTGIRLESMEFRGMKAYLHQTCIALKFFPSAICRQLLDTDVQILTNMAEQWVLIALDYFVHLRRVVSLQCVKN